MKKNKFFKLSEEEQKKLYLDIDERRGKGKRVNFAATYNAGVAKLASLLDDDVKLAQNLYNTYWKRNWAIKEVIKNIQVKTVRGHKWVFNPVSKFWYSLKNEKDIFSVINQSTGNFVFNVFLKNVIEIFKKHKINKKQQLQYHDEFLFLVEQKDAEIIVNKILPEAMKKTNDQLNLNVTFSYSVKIGNTYAETH